MIVRRQDRRSRSLQPGVEHAVLSYDDALMLCEVSLAEGVLFPPHSHPHVQIAYVVSGRVSFTLDEETFPLEAGDSCLVPPHSVHSLVALEDTVVLDAFHPAREDFVAP